MKPISFEQRDRILESLRVGCDLEASCKAQGVTAADALKLMGADAGWQSDVVAATGVGADARKAAFAEVAAHSASLDATPAKAPPRELPRLTVATDDGAPDWTRFRADAADRYGDGRMGLYLLQDERLVARGLPATSPWWQWTIDCYFESGLVWLLVMVGRGGGKSTTLERFMLSIIMHTLRTAPPGQTWQCPFISVRPEDAKRRIFELQTMLRAAYFIDTKVQGGAISVNDSSGNPIEIASMAATIGNVSGASTVCTIIDEAAKMQTNPTGANPDGEMIASLAETSRARDGWAGVRCSSAWETRGAHFASIVEGTNLANYVATIGPMFIDDALHGHEVVARWESAQGNTHGAAQIRAFAKSLNAGSPNVPTWVANPTISALASRLILETLPKDSAELDGLDRTTYWLRENASMPLAREGGPRFDEQCHLAASVTRRLSEKHGQGPQRPPEAAGVMKVPGAHPGDARYAGPTQRARGGVALGWRKRTVI